MSCLHCTSFEALRCLVCTAQDRQAFFSKYWEKQPAVFKATPGREALFQGMCSLPTVLNWLRQREKKAGPLEFGVDINAARYKDGTRTTPNGEVRACHTNCRHGAHAAAPDAAGMRAQ
jgi:hypothetical protein